MKRFSCRATPSGDVAFIYEDDGDCVFHDDALAAIEQARREVLDEVLRGLRSERDTDQLRAIIASVEYIRARGEVGK